jgi:hypothetical protein
MSAIYFIAVNPITKNRSDWPIRVLYNLKAANECLAFRLRKKGPKGPLPTRVERGLFDCLFHFWHGGYGNSSASPRKPFEQASTFHVDSYM